MRSVMRAARQQPFGRRRPALRARRPRRRATAAWPRAARRPACELVATSGSAQRSQVVRPSAPRASAARSARPCRRAAPWATTAPPCPCSASTCATPERRRAAQDAADVAGILHAVEHHASAHRRAATARVGRSISAPMRRGRLQRAQLVEQRVGHAPARARPAAPVRAAPAAPRPTVGQSAPACSGRPRARQARTGGRPPATPAPCWR